MKIIIELDGAGNQQPEIKKETSVVMEQPSTTSLASFVSASPVDAGSAPSYDGVASPPDGSSSSEHPGQSTMPFSFAGAIDAGAAKTADELLPTGMQEVSDPDTSEQGGAYSPGSYVNIETHHN